MKHSIFSIKNIVVFFSLVLQIHSSYAQKLISGVVKTKSNEYLGYTNIDYWIDGKKTTSLLSDNTGNFSFVIDDLHTGIVVFNQAGYYSKSLSINFLNDSFLIVVLEKDTSHALWSNNHPSFSKYHFEKSLPRNEITISDDVMVGHSGIYIDEAPSGRARETLYRGMAKIDESISPHKSKVGKGILTAGEINDFSKWELWKDISGQQLIQNLKYWQIHLQDRYSVQVTYKNDLPVVDAQVKLMSQNNILFSAKTDNTGKAELWNTTQLELKPYKNIQIFVSFMGEDYVIGKSKTISQGTNLLKIDNECDMPSKVDIAFVVDATGSMGSEIEFLKEEMKEVLRKSKMVAPHLIFRYANVFYRDHGDQYLTKKQPFQEILTESISFIAGQRAAGGGDYEEAVDVALDTAINHLNWSENAVARILFLVLDAPPHNTPEIRAKLHRIMFQAAEKGIRIVPVVASGINKNAEYLMRCMALATNGTYTFLTRHSGIGSSHIEPTTDEFKVEQLEDVLERILKTYTFVPNCENETLELPLEYPDSMVTFTPPKDSIQNDTSIINQPVLKHYWKYYPNPTRGDLFIETSTDISELHITDISGKLVVLLKNVTSEKIHTVDLSQLSSGIYFIRYPLNGRLITGKFILNRAT
jgi:hypothetical protein